MTIDKEVQFAQIIREITMHQKTTCDQEVFVVGLQFTQIVTTREVAINLDVTLALEVLRKDPPITELAEVGAVDSKTTCQQRAFVEDLQYGAQKLEVKEVSISRQR